MLVRNAVLRRSSCNVWCLSEVDGILLADASNAFNRLNRGCCLQNFNIVLLLRHSCPSLSTAVINTYMYSACLRSVPPLIYYDMNSSLSTCPLRLCVFHCFYLTLSFFTELLLLFILLLLLFPPLTFIYRRGWQSPTLLTLAGVSTES